VDAQGVLQAVLRGTLSGGRKRGSRALQTLWRGDHPLLNARTLLTLGGLAWGVYEAATATQGTPVPPPPTPAPPLPPALPDGALRLLRLAISAARADGVLQEAERRAILQEARSVGAEALVQAELDRPLPLDQILPGGVPENQRPDLYVLAYTIVRADEGVSGSERIFLAQLANRLGLGPDRTQALEESTAARIDAESEKQGAA
jgi:uncharacterized membrane protein YebE (DUF533 family)